MENHSLFRTFCLVVGVIVAVLGLAWAAFVRHDRVAPRGEELRYDDFTFRVKDARCSKTLGLPGSLATAHGTFWIVDLDVGNRAKRVSYRLDSHQVVVVDADGHRIEPSREGGIALAAEGGSLAPVEELAHGESCTSRYVFDVPDATAAPRLKIRFGAVGSFLDDVLLGELELVLR